MKLKFKNILLVCGNFFYMVKYNKSVMIKEVCFSNFFFLNHNRRAAQGQMRNFLFLNFPNLLNLI